MNRHIISSKIREHARNNPDNIAIQYQDHIFLTYQKFIESFDVIIERLDYFGIEPNDRILGIFQQRINYLLTVLPTVETAVFTTSEFLTDMEILKYKIDLYKITYILSDTISENLIELLSDIGCGLLKVNFDAKTTSVSINRILLCKQPAKPTSFVKNLALITQTSGTTATPKLIGKSYQLLIENCVQESEVYDADHKQVRLATAPLHRTNTAFSFMKLLYGQVRVICCDSANPALIKNLLEEFKVTHFRSAPASIISFMDYLKNNQISLKCPELQYIFVPGAAISEQFVQRINEHFNAQLIHTYGSTETSNITSNYKTNAGYRSGSVGVAVYHDIKIIEGEICVKGKTVFEGYENADNQEYFIDGYFRTGDAGYLDEDGYLYITGRIKEMINRGGDKVSPYELEKEIDLLGIFKELAIFPYPGQDMVEEIGLVGVLKDATQSVKLSSIRGQLMNRLPSFKLPTKLIITDEIPKSANQKIQRKSLYPLLIPFEIAEESREPAIEELLNESEAVLIDLYKIILKVKDVSVSDNFIALGGDSLKAAELYSELVAKYHVKLPMVDLFACADVREMAAFLNRYVKTDHPFKYIVPLVKGNDDFVPLVFIHAVAGDAVTYRYLASKISIDESIYALEFNIKESDWDLPPDTSRILDDYLKELLILRPQGVFTFCGLSMGGRIALEIAHQLKEKGYPASKVIMLDTVYVKGNKRGKSFNLVRSLKRVSFDLKMKRHGNLIQYLIFKVERLLQNRLAKNKVRNDLEVVVSKKMSSRKRDFSPAEIEIIISTYFKTPVQDRYDLDVIYLLAKKEENTANAEFVASRVKTFRQIEMDCYHSDFVSLHADETADVLEMLIKEVR